MKHASDMLNKLGNIARIHNTEVILSLSPKHYYDLCKKFTPSDTILKDVKIV